VSQSTIQRFKIGYKNISACIDTPVMAQVLKPNPLTHQQRQSAPFSLIKKEKEKRRELWQQTCGKAE